MWFTLVLQLPQGPPGYCTGCTVSSSSKHFYIGEPGDERAKYGSSDNPAVSCYDLTLERDDIKSDSTYYVDPNGGNVGDAIEVTCRKVGDEWSTCIQPEDGVS